MTRETRNPTRFSSRQERLLDPFRTDKGLDLTDANVLAVMERLRKENPDLAKKLSTSRDPVVNALVFRRRSRKLRHASSGTAVRLALLPQNPHFLNDTKVVREILGIPDAHLKLKITRPGHRNQTGGDSDMGQVLMHPKVIGWLHVHRLASGRNDIESDPLAPEGLEVEGPSYRISAQARQVSEKSALIDLAATSSPEWLRRKPDGTGFYQESTIPIYWAVGRLVERHHLPWRIALNILVFVLTLNEGFITDLETLDVSVRKDSGGDPDALTIEVKGIDEYTSKKQWDKIWKDNVEPLQKNLLGLRGILPHGRRFPNVDRLRKGLGIYQEVVVKGVPLNDLINWSDTGWEPEAARRVILDLRQYIEPDE